MPETASTLLESVDFTRIDATRRLLPERRAELGQFLTPAPTAALMAAMFEARGPHIKLLDPGAGVGSLSAAFVEKICGRAQRPQRLHIIAYEIDPQLSGYLAGTLQQCSAACRAAGIDFEFQIRQEDFIQSGCRLLGTIFEVPEQFDCVIANPPYRKVATASDEHRALAAVGAETSNLYTAFLGLAVRMLKPGGELVAITPRSFCNGTYFAPFRRELLHRLSFRRIHMFDSRQKAFRDDSVLQENIIFHAIAGDGARAGGEVEISTSSGPKDELVSTYRLPRHMFVRPDDPKRFFRLIPDEMGAAVSQQITALPKDLAGLGLEISTGRVVDFRARDQLQKLPGKSSFPLIYPSNFQHGYVCWPRPGKKPQALSAGDATKPLLVPSEAYVLTRRFSSKEEKRRVVAAVYDPGRVAAEWVGFENHINYIHRNGGGIGLKLAKGLSAFLNSSLVDMYFRQFSGHTQVNADDLRNLRYPALESLERIGAKIDGEFPQQPEIDRLIDEVIPVPENANTPHPVQARQKIEDAQRILKALGVSRDQQNERSALTLLALLNLRPSAAWRKAEAPMIGITPMMEFFKEHYGKQYAPNTREAVRRQTVHQFLDAGFIVINPDEPERPTNSGKTVYQIESSLLKLVHAWGTPAWRTGLEFYLAGLGSLKERYAQQRRGARIPLVLPRGPAITLTSGGQNVLVQRIIEDFCAFFTPGGRPVYVGDTGDKFAFFDGPLLGSLGVALEPHGKIPDVIIYHETKNWLVLIEAVTSHGPVDPKRMSELKRLFASSAAGLVFVTAFLDRRTMAKYLGDISWETEVWVAEAPEHLIHFNGERFLGPYAD